MSAVMTERLVAVAQAIRAAGHGGKQAIYEQACSELGISLATLHRKLRELTVKKPRKVRADAGKSDLTYDEALLIVGAVKETTRGNDKVIWALMDAVTALRANGLVRAERVDPRTGEITPLSESAIRRVLRGQAYHRGKVERRGRPKRATPKVIKTFEKTRKKLLKKAMSKKRV